MKKLDSELSELISALENAKALKYSGSLQCRARGTAINYYQQLENGSTKYIKNSENTLLKNLAWKTQIQKTLEAARREKGQVERSIRIFESDKPISDIEEVYDSLHEGVRKLVGRIKLSDDAYAAEWVKERKKSVRRAKVIDGDLITMNKETVKSKSELIIADKLFTAGVPYVYEPIMTFDDGEHFLYPDFIVMNKRTREEYLWEHLGMIDDEKYLVKNQKKIEEYGDNGFFPGKNLILTFESSSRSLSTEYVDLLIKDLLV